jgi:hypothetical protein
MQGDFSRDQQQKKHLHQRCELHEDGQALRTSGADRDAFAAAKDVSRPIWLSSCKSIEALLLSSDTEAIPAASGGAD